MDLPITVTDLFRRVEAIENSTSATTATPSNSILTSNKLPYLQMLNHRKRQENEDSMTTIKTEYNKQVVDLDVKGNIAKLINFTIDFVLNYVPKAGKIFQQISAGNFPNAAYLAFELISDLFDELPIPHDALEHLIEHFFTLKIDTTPTSIAIDSTRGVNQDITRGMIEDTTPTSVVIDTQIKPKQKKSFSCLSRRNVDT